MWLLVRTQLRGNLGRVVGAIVAATLASGFFATVLLLIHSADEAAKRSLGSSATDTQVGLQAILGFVAVGLLVAGFVVFNTFAVVIVQRTQELALLRTLGASRSQLRQSILAESAIVGVIAGAAGSALAVALSAILTVIASMPFDFDLNSLIAPLAVTAILVIAAALIPAHAATRIAPLAAMRQQQVADQDRPGSTARLSTGIALFVIGLSAFAAGALAPDFPQWLGGLGAVMAIVGWLLSALWLVPFGIAAVGRLAGNRGIATQLARINALRHPRRVTTAANAFIIGIALVAMAHTALATATARLDQMLVHLADKAGVGLDEKREMLHSLMGELAGSISALLTVAVLVAVVGIANTMSLSVSERSREHALLRALGLTRAQLRRTLLQEAVLIALTAAGIGALLGAVYGTLSVSLLLKGHGVGEFTVVVPWEPIVGTLLVGLIAGILAALLPSRRAARLSPVAALSME